MRAYLKKHKIVFGGRTWKKYIKMNLRIMSCVESGVRSKVRNVFALSNTGIVGSNPTRDMDVLFIFCVFVLSCVRSSLMAGRFLLRGVLPTAWKIRGFQISSKWDETRRHNPSEEEEEDEDEEKEEEEEEEEKVEEGEEEVEEEKED
jgi:hypothetical protein